LKDARSFKEMLHYFFLNETDSTVKNQTPHAVMPRETHDEAARRDFVSSLKVHILTKLAPGNRVAFDRRAEPKFRKEHGRVPETRREVASVMYRDSYWQTWSSLNRTAQELMWDALGESIERQLPDLIEKAHKIRNQDRKRGSLQLDPDLEIPPYNSDVDIHAAPGGYHTELVDNDVYAGALYDLGAYDYSLGGQGPDTDDIGRSLAAYLKKSLTDFSPSKILDMGCGVGHQTIPFMNAFRDAELHGIDIAAPMLRYGHARAESMAKAVHFSQQNAESTDFEDRSFDLIFSTILLHETSAIAVKNIFCEAFRLLRSGGVMVHSEVPEANKFWPDPYDQFQRDWTTYFNGEPFRSKVRDMNLAKLAKRTGFPEEKIVETRIPSLFGSTLYADSHAYGAQWWILLAQKECS